ncbi:hypothetical protein HDU76_001694 [Blyttiomyces sp. JEL0837]|nr:hypothetical protein HDU76_001694 [Blyttiomyces sp. JEL0837]
MEVLAAICLVFLLAPRVLCLIAGSAGKGFQLRGRQWNYSPITDGQQATGDFIHIQGSCASDASLLTLSSNWTIQLAFKFHPEEVSMSDPAVLFAQGQEFHYMVLYGYYSPFGYVWIPAFATQCDFLYNMSAFVFPTMWHLLTIRNENYHFTMILDGNVIATLYCPVPWPANTPPVWSIGARDWSTDVTVSSVLTPYYAFDWEMAEFRFWSKPLTYAEILYNTHRTLNTTELKDPSLHLYFDLDNINGKVVPDKSSSKRLNGYLGGTMGKEVQTPRIVPSTAPIVDINAVTRVVNVYMKESGDYASTVPIYIYAIDETQNNMLVSGTTNASLTMLSGPNPSVLTISLTPGGRTLSPSFGPISLFSNFTLYATHLANISMLAWEPQLFNVSVAMGNTYQIVTVNVTIFKNSPPRIGTNGGALVPGNVPDGFVNYPYVINNFLWPNATLNQPITWEFWFIPASDSRSLFAPQLKDLLQGRINAEVGRNLVFDYGWNKDGSGRTSTPISQKFGIWHHAAMTSDGIGGFQKLYIDGELVSQNNANAPGRVPASNATNILSLRNIPIDELRIWNINRTQDQILSTMFKSLNGNEPYLYMHHDFQSYTINSDGSYTFKDASPNSFDMNCYGYFSATGCPLVLSQAPLGSYVGNLTFEDGANSTFWNPQGSDIDDETRFLRFVVDRIPSDAKMFMDRNVTFRFLDGDNRGPGSTPPSYVSPISSGSYIRREMFTPAVQIVASVIGGGNPYDSFTYHVTDGLRNSPSATVYIFRKCSPGYWLDNTAKICNPCKPGYYFPSFSYSSQCLPCQPGTAQPLSGQSSCVPCSAAIFSSASGTTNNTTTLLPKITIGTDNIEFYGTHQISQGQATCKLCLGLSYAIENGAQFCEGQAFVPNYISLVSVAIPPRTSTNGYISANGSFLRTNETWYGNITTRINQDIVLSLADIESGPEALARISLPAQGVVAAAVILAALTFLLIIGVVIFRNDPVIRASTPSSLIQMGFGIMLCYILISKTFRILRFFNNPRAMMIRMTNLELFGYMLIAVSINIVVLTAWVVIDSPVPTVFHRGNTPTMVYLICQSKSYVTDSIFTGVVYLYNVLLLAVAGILAYLTRTVSTLYCESKYIGYFLTVSLGGLGILITLLSSSSNDVSANFVLRAISTLLVATSAAIFLIGIKFYIIFINRTGEKGLSATELPLLDSIIPPATLAKWAGSRNGKHLTSVLSTLSHVYKNRPGAMIAGVVQSVKRFGVVFWRPKVAILQQEERLLLLVDADPTKLQNPATAGFPETVPIPLYSFTVTSPPDNHQSRICSENSTSSGQSAHGQVRSNNSASDFTYSTLLSISLPDNGQIITIQFESALVKAEWSTALAAIASITPLNAADKSTARGKSGQILATSMKSISSKFDLG